MIWVWYIRYTRAYIRHTHFHFRRVGSKVGNITSNSVHCFSSPAVRIPPPPVLLWHPAHCVHSWEHWPPPLWEWTCGVCSGSLCAPIPQWCPLCVVVHCLSHSKITLSLHPYMHLMDTPYTLTVWLYTSSLVLQFHLLCTLYGWLHMTSILFDQYPNWLTHASPSVPALFICCTIKNIYMLHGGSLYRGKKKLAIYSIIVDFNIHPLDLYTLVAYSCLAATMCLIRVNQHNYTTSITYAKILVTISGKTILILILRCLIKAHDHMVPVSLGRYMYCVNTESNIGWNSCNWWIFFSWTHCRLQCAKQNLSTQVLENTVQLSGIT